MKSIAVAALMVVSVVMVHAQTSAPPPPGWDEVVRFYEQRVRDAGIVGSSLELVRDGRVVAAHQVGYQDLEAKRPVTPDTIFHWGRSRRPSPASPSCSFATGSACRSTIRR